MKYERCKDCKNIHTFGCMLCFYGDKYEPKNENEE